MKELTRGSKTSQDQAKLGGSIRSSRSMVRSVYSSKVSESGSSFERGDAPARSALRRLVRRLRAFLHSVVTSFSKDSRSGIDYDSLMSLSNGSGLEAIRTMTDLSERVSVRSTSSRGTVQSRDRRKSGESRRLSRSNRNSSASSTGSRTSKSAAKLRKPPAGTKETKPRSSPGQRKDHNGPRRPASHQRPAHSTDSVGRRQSTLTTSSDSTKLGEIRHEEHTRPAQATYPLRAHRREPVTPPKKGKLFGLFSR